MISSSFGKLTALKHSSELRNWVYIEREGAVTLMFAVALDSGDVARYIAEPVGVLWAGRP